MLISGCPFDDFGVRDGTANEYGGIRSALVWGMYLSSSLKRLFVVDTWAIPLFLAL